jgi:TonB family protein
MKRVICGVLMAAAFFLVLYRPASAMIEFCPARLSYARVGPESAKDQPSSLYGANLSALGPRTVTSATLAFDTSAGWFTFDAPAMTLVEKARHYTNPTVSFIRRDYVSPRFYVRFPTDVTIAHAWVYSASAKDDGAFGWQAQGTVRCDPPAAASPEQAKRFPKNVHPFYTLADADKDGLSDEPTSTSLILAAAPSKALENFACTEPFREATVKTQVVPQYPDIMRGRVGMDATVSVEVALNGDGSLADAWVWGPSGFQPFDDAALLAAKASTYEGGRAYCAAVPGSYFFRVTFDPNG